MIECPKCKSKNLSILTFPKSKKVSYKFLDTIQNICLVVLSFTAVILIAVIATSFEAFEQIINTGISMSLVNELATEAAGLIILLIVEEWSIIGVLVTCVIKIFLPHKVYYLTKCICHECEEIWDYTMKAPAEQNENKDDAPNE